MTALAHIAGLPLEETALSFGPVLAAGGGIAVLRLRERFGRRLGGGARSVSRRRFGGRGGRLPAVGRRRSA